MHAILDKLDAAKRAKILRCGAAIIALASLLFLFGTAYIWRPSSETNFVFSNGFNFIFGSEVAQKVSSNTVYKENGHMSLMGLFGLIFALLGGLLLLVSLFFKKDSFWSKVIFNLVSFALLLTAGILFLSSKRELANIVAYVTSNGSEAVTNTIYNNGKMGYGIMVPGIFLVVTSLGPVASLFVDGSSSILKAKIDKLLHISK